LGRPSDYTPEVATLICERLAAGESLRRMCADRVDLPSERSVYRWLAEHQEFRQQYAQAREHQVEPHLEEMFAIADDPEIKPDDKRIRIDVRKWAMSKLAPKKYGDKTLLGNDPDNPLPAPTTDTDLARLAVFLLSKESKK
jgi:hypothetical protein